LTLVARAAYCALVKRITKISDSAVRRLSHYLRFLDDFESRGEGTVSSDDLAERGGVTSAQVRKDLSHFGSFGKRGMGYPVPVLRRRIAEILGLGRTWRVALVGGGKLGAALFHYAGFRRQGFEIVAVLDNDPAKVGQRWGTVVVDDVDDLPQVIERREIELAIVATPAGAAQEVVDALVEARIRAILNFAPRRLHVPSEVTLRDVNLTIEMESLTFALTQMGR
jgi:redox-sensing transcriptional repressor